MNPNIQEICRTDSWNFETLTLRGKNCEYGEIKRISPYLVRMQENTDQKKLRIWTLFTQCEVQHIKRVE